MQLKWFLMCRARKTARSPFSPEDGIALTFGNMHTKFEQIPFVNA